MISGNWDAVGVKDERRPGPGGWMGIRDYVRCALAVGEMEGRKLWHDPTELLTRALQPALWLVIFGEAMARLRAIPSGGVPYLTFLTPGILAQSLMFVAIFYGLGVIWDRDAGLLQKFLVLPVPRTAFVTGRGLGAGVRALVQGIIVLGLARALGVHLRWTLGGVVGSLAAVVVGAGIFATLSMLIAIAVKTRERFMGIGQVITMPLFFASNAIYPLSIMPPWLHAVAAVNPLTGVVDLLRGYLVTGHVVHALQVWAVLGGILVGLEALAGRLYHKLAL
ncbi:MAG: ABC transporter permease [Actinomycetia bacterium]|nr:ABC transporter permease [Actinomycetes bacterium]